MCTFSKFLGRRVGEKKHIVLRGRKESPNCYGLKNLINIILIAVVSNAQHGLLIYGTAILCPGIS